MEIGFDVDLAGFALPFPQIEDFAEGGGIGSGEIGDSVEGGAAILGHGQVKSEESVAKKSAEGGDGGGHDVQVSLVAERSAEDGLTETNGSGAQFALDLQTMELERYFESGEEILAE